jgi:hypothetical protein
MLLLAKVALGIGSTMVVAGAYTFHEGVIRVDVDEHRDNGSHIHFWVPAAVVPLALHIAPRREMERAAREAGPYMPMLRTLTKELEKYPDVTFVEVTEPGEHVQIQTHQGRLQIDVEDSDNTVHIACPLAAIEDVADQLESHRPGA